MNIAIYSDPLMGKGGGSRVIIDLANALNADIITSGFDEKLRKRLKKGIKVINIGNILIKKSHPAGYLFEAPLRFILSPKFSYDLHIYTGCMSIYGAKKNQKNIWFSFSPNRVMYDLRDWKMKKSSFFKKIFLFLHVIFFKNLDQNIIKSRFVKIIAQTENVQARIKDYYGEASEVIYSPVNTSTYKFNKFGDYYFTVARLVPEKRIDLIVKAFTKMPSKDLIVAGTGPELDKIKSMIKGYKNITLLGSVDEEKLIELYSNCLATIYMPVNEDFGLIPIEGMASGKICIAADEGGCRETIINKKTGYLIKADVEEIVQTVNIFSISKAKEMRKECEIQAMKFDSSIITNQWCELLTRVNQ